MLTKIYGTSMIFSKSKIHTGNAYRNKGNAKQGCTIHGIFKNRHKYSKN
jgi:hypothetical protein